MIRSTKVMYSTLILWMFMIMFSSIVSVNSQNYYKQQDVVDIKVQCISNGTFCSSSSLCNLTVFYPNNSGFIINQKMTNQVSFYNYTLPSTILWGTYSCTSTCCQGNLCGTQSCDFIINGIGSELSIPQSFLYFILLGGVLIVLLFTGWGALMIPWNNPRSEDGYLLDINDLKYLKVILWICVYLEVLFIMAILRNLSGGYLAVEGTYSFFNILYFILLIGLLPLFPALIFFTIIIWINDKKLLKNVSRGLPA